MGSVSWNSSTSTTENRARSRARAAAPSCGWRSARCRRNEHVVEREQPAPALAPLDLGAHGLGEPRPRARRVGGVAPGLDARAGVVDHGLADGERRGAVEVGGLRAGDGVLAQVEVVDDLGDHVVDALDERAVGIGVADDPEAGEHVLAELVGGRDRGGVEARERGTQPGAPEGHDGVVALGEQPDHGVVVAAGARRVGQRALGGHEPAPHPLAQLARRLAPERHEHDLRQRRVALGDVAGRERGDRVRLAGARAGLEHRGAAREVAADVEGARERGGHRLPSSSASRTGVHSRVASPANRLGASPVAAPTRSSSRRRRPQTRTCAGSSCSPP